MMLLAQGVVGGYSLVQVAIFVVIMLAVCAIVYVAAKAMGIAIPQWLINIVLIVIVAIVAIVAIKVVASL